MSEKYYPCDGENGYCPYNAEYSNSCEYCCGLGRDEDIYEDIYDEDC